MSYNFTMENVTEFINFKDIKNYDITFPKDIGKIVCQKEVVTDDILLFRTKTISNEYINMVENSKINGLAFNFCINGKLQYKDNISNKIESFQQNDIMIRYLANCNTTINLNKNDKTKSLGLIVRNTFLEDNIFNNIPNKDEFMSLFLQSILKKENPNSIKLAKELFNSPFLGNLHNIYIQSKVLELIYNELQNINESLFKKSYSCKYKVKLSKEDIEALHKAKNIIHKKQDFPDLKTLARKVALNEFKLKYGFKELFNTSVGQMILEQKMLYAKELLQTSEYSISQIASLVGYKYIQSFSNAFFQFFSIRPKDLMKTRNYYY